MRTANAPSTHLRHSHSRTGARQIGAPLEAGHVRSLRFARMTQEVVLPQLVRFITSKGLPGNAIVQNLRKLADLIEAGRRIPTAPSREYDLVIRISSVAHDWARSPDYTGKDGEPRALTLTGQRSLSVLIRRHFPRRSVSSVLTRMTTFRAVRRRADGRYILLQPQIVLGSSLESARLEWIATRAIQYINAACTNFQRKPGSRQLDRVASVFDLPEKEVPRFREFSKACSESWMAQIDNWLEDHSAPKGRQRRVEAGIHVYGYVGSVQKIASS